MLKMIDCFTGIGGFHLAAEAEGIHTIVTSETESFNCRHIDQKLNLDNVGDVASLGISEHQNPNFTHEDIVPVEETGFSTYSYEDFMEGTVDWPDIISGGWPCQDIAPANPNNANGINGTKSSTYKELVRLLEDFEPKYGVFENSERLSQRGLCVILKELDRLGYHAQWETISASAFGYPHYRHRLYLVVYRNDTNIARYQLDAFSECRKEAKHQMGLPFKLPLTSEDPNWHLKNAVVDNPKSIKLRTKRINSLGNAIIPDIARAIFRSIKKSEDNPSQCEKVSQRVPYEKLLSISLSTVSNEKAFLKLPSRGLMLNGSLFNTDKCSLLNPHKTHFKGMLSTLIKKDGNNNFTTKSRLNRPGKLGGLVQDIMKLGVVQGGLHPEFCEKFMGYPQNYTKPL